MKLKDRLHRYAIEHRMPLSGAFELTPVCNFSCKMCYVRKNAEEVKCAGGVKPLSFWMDVAKQAADAGMMYPLLTGGETFLYPHLKELYIEMCRMGMQVSINSNGSQITEEEIEWLREYPPIRINVTLYGASNESYEKLCGDPNGFDRVKSGIQLLADNHIRFKLNCSLTPYNAQDLKGMIQFGKQYGKELRIASYMFPPVRRTGRSGDYEERFTAKEAAYYQVLANWLQMPLEEFARLASGAKNFTELTPALLKQLADQPAREMGCLSGRCSCWVDWQGNLSGCGMMDMPKICLSDHLFADAWKQVVEWTEQMRYSPICGNCPNRNLCFSCAAMVYNETGGFADRPVYLCEKAKYAAEYYAEFLKKVPKDILENSAKEPVLVAEECFLEE